MSGLPTVIDDFSNVPDAARGGVVVIGNFDGVHKGHQALLREARQIGSPVGVLVFEPHPAEYFGRVEGPFRLAPLNSKVHMLGDYGIDFVYVCQFDETVASLSAAEFAKSILVDALGAEHVVVGYDFRYGKDRAGDLASLQAQGAEQGFDVHVVDAVRETHDGAVFSSSLIRQLLREGEPEKAANLLGHPWYVEGMVIEGDQRGRTIGFPTANVSMGGYLEPRLGVYTVDIEVMDGAHQGHYRGVANLGKRPTFDKKDVLLEVHLFDFEGDLYGATVRVSFLHFIRPEQKFDGLDALKTQIAVDCDIARADPPLYG